VYRQLLGRIPPEELFTYPKALPVRWGEQKKQVVIPWLFSYVLDKADEELLAQHLTEYRSENSGSSSR